MTQAIAALYLILALQIPEPGSVSGRVTDASGGGPVTGVTIQALTAPAFAESDSAGGYRLAPLPEGWHVIRYRRLGYRQVELHAYVPDGVAASVDVALPIHPLPVRSIDVTARRGSPPPGWLLDGDGTHVGTTSFGVASLESHPLLDRPELPAALGTLPDVSIRPDGGGGIHLRGGSADQTLIALDGAPILAPLHAMGMAGSLNPDVVAAVDVYAGVIPAEYGGRLAGVVAVESREPDPAAWHVRAGGDGFTTGLSVDGPVVGDRAGLLLSARHSTDGVLAWPHEEGGTLPRFWDFFASGSGSLASGVLRLSAYRSSDRLAFAGESGREAVPRPSGPGTSRFLWDAGTDAISWRRRSAGRRIELVLWRATADAGAAWSGAVGPLETESRAMSRGGRAVFGFPLAAGWIRWGAGFERHDVGYATPDDDPGTGSTTGASEISLFGEWHRIFADRLGVTGGLRSSLDGDAEPELEPRLSLSWMPSPRAQVGIGYSRSRQIVHSLRNEESVLDVAVPTDFLGRVDGDGGPRAKADQVNVSLRMRVSPGAEVRAGAYARRMSGLVLVAPLTAEPVAVSGFARGSGRALGLQGSASLTGGDWQGYAAYHLGHSTRTADGAAYRPLFHRTHWGLVGVSRRVSRHLAMRARTRVGSGTPSSPVSPGFSWEASDPVLGEGDLAGIPLRVGDGLNETTLPLYARVDLGVRGAWAVSVLERAGEIAAFVTVENLFGRRNLLTYRLDPEVGALRPVALRPLGLNAGVGIAF